MNLIGVETCDDNVIDEVADVGNHDQHINVDLSQFNNMVYEGMVCDSKEDAFKKYNEFARKVGFSVRKDKIYKRADGSIRSRMFVCFQQGLRKEDKRCKNTTKARNESRTDCKARMIIINEEDEWTVFEIFYEHNHVLATPSKAYMLRSQRKFKDVHLAEDFKRCIYNCNTEEFLLSKWKKMLDDYGLGENIWLGTLFKVRKKWALVYGRDMFCADMTTTQRSESINKFLKKFVKRKYYFTEFLNRFEMALETRRQTEVEEDFKSSQTSPNLVVPILMLKQASERYTHAIFDLFSNEYKAHLMYTIEERDVDGSIFRYEITTKGAIIEEVYTVAMRVLKNGLEEVELTTVLPHKDSVENPKSTKTNVSQSNEVKVKEILTVAQGCERDLRQCDTMLIEATCSEKNVHLSKSNARKHPTSPHQNEVLNKCDTMPIETTCSEKDVHSSTNEENVVLNPTLHAPTYYPSQIVQPLVP
ncbi:hypothetical protein GIB67_039600 [Kingdonia uniflora]|uniref:Protein FAR1-RELATED SEQUENCE n=1 Tax=Kingdonia uniflora TaxID=39325 RepID=A0A7J7P702_9MAGN|nr:hypothetical protein GIB67_039600 [Kingdonia uniflora]